MIPNRLPPLRAAVSIFLAALLSACALTSNGLTDPTATVPHATVPPTAAPAADTPAPTAPADTPAPAPGTQPVTSTATPLAEPLVAFVGPADAPAGSPAALSLAGAQAAASTSKARFQVFDTGTQDPAAAFSQAAQAGVAVVVAAGDGLTDATQAAARAGTSTKFIGVGQSPADLPNYVSLGGAGDRLDEAGFMGGALAGMLSVQRKVGLVTVANDPAGRVYQAGFIHGLRYTCGDCDLTKVEVDDPNEAGKGERIAANFKSGQIDVAAAAAGSVGSQMLTAADSLGLMTFSLDGSLPAGPLVLGGVMRRPDKALPDLIQAALAGSALTAKPYSLADGSLAYSDLGPAVSPAVTSYLNDMLAQLASGALDTGVDPATGADK